MRRAALMTAAAFGLFLGAAAQAADSSADESRLIPPRRSVRAGQAEGQLALHGSPRNREAGGGWLTTLGGLTAVLALVFLTAKVVKRSVPAVQKSLPAEVVQVLGRTAVDYRHQIHLVRFGSRMLVLGTSQEGLRTLSEITDPVEIDYLAGLCKPSEPASVAGTFRQLFQRFHGPEPGRFHALSEAGHEPDAAVAAPEESEVDAAILQLQERLQHSAHRGLSEAGNPHSTEAAG